MSFHIWVGITAWSQTHTDFVFCPCAYLLPLKKYQCNYSVCTNIANQSPPKPNSNSKNIYICYSSVIPCDHAFSVHDTISYYMSLRWVLFLPFCSSWCHSLCLYSRCGTSADYMVFPRVTNIHIIELQKSSKEFLQSHLNVLYPMPIGLSNFWEQYDIPASGLSK